MARPASAGGADLARVVAAATISMFGSMLSGVALPLLAVDQLGAGIAGMALLRIARLLPNLLFGLAIAAWLDRVRRRRVLIAIDLAQACLLAALLVAACCGALSLPVLWVFTACSSACGLTFGIARQSYVPSIADQARLVHANSRIAAGEAAAEAGAFALGGWLVQLLGAPITLATDALSFLGSALCLGAIRAREPTPAGARERRGRIGAGLHAIAVDPRLRVLAGTAWLIAFANELTAVVYMVYVRRELGFAQGLLGMLFALGAVGALGGSALAERLGLRLGSLHACVVGLLAQVLAYCVLASAHPASWLGAGAIGLQQLVGDFGMVTVQIHSLSLVQRIAPRGQLARVNGAIAFGASWAMLAGSTLGALAGGMLGSRGMIALAAAGFALAAIMLAVTSSRPREPSRTARGRRSRRACSALRRAR